MGPGRRSRRSFEVLLEKLHSSLVQGAQPCGLRRLAAAGSGSRQFAYAEAIHDLARRPTSRRCSTAEGEPLRLRRRGRAIARLGRTSRRRRRSSASEFYDDEDFQLGLDRSPSFGARNVIIAVRAAGWAWRCCATARETQRFQCGRAARRARLGRSVQATSCSPGSSPRASAGQSHDRRGAARRRGRGGGGDAGARRGPLRSAAGVAGSRLESQVSQPRPGRRACAVGRIV